MQAAKNLEVDCDNDDQELGVKILLDVVRAPMKQMALNAGESPDLIVNTVESSEPNFGWNFATGELVDMLATGIIDPVKVTRVALQNAVSASSTLLTTNYAIIQED